MIAVQSKLRPFIRIQCINFSCAFVLFCLANAEFRNSSVLFHLHIDIFSCLSLIPSYSDDFLCASLAHLIRQIAYPFDIIIARVYYWLPFFFASIYLIAFYFATFLCDYFFVQCVKSIVVLWSTIQMHICAHLSRTNFCKLRNNHIARQVVTQITRVIQETHAIYS